MPPTKLPTSNLEDLTTTASDFDEAEKKKTKGTFYRAFKIVFGGTTLHPALTIDFSPKDPLRQI